MDLVTGGAGFIGSSLVHRLVADGRSVRVLDDFSTGRRQNLADVADRIEIVEGSVADAAVAARAVQGVDVVFHEAALASVPLSIERPLEVHDACATGTLVLLDACRKAGVRRVVYAGSSSAYGDDPTPLKSESVPPRLLSPYAAAKFTGEAYAEAFATCYPLEIVRLRYFNVFGPRQDPGSPYSAVIPLFATALLEGRRPIVYGDGGQTRDFVFVEDVVQANLLAAHTDGVSGRVFNVGTGEAVSVLGLLQTICRLLEVPCDPEFRPPRAGEVRDSCADVSAARRDLGYEPSVPFDEGLRRTIAWYRQSLGES